MSFVFYWLYLFFFLVAIGFVLCFDVFFLFLLVLKKKQNNCRKYHQTTAEHHHHHHRCFCLEERKIERTIPLKSFHNNRKQCVHVELKQRMESFEFNTGPVCADITQMHGTYYVLQSLCEWEKIINARVKFMMNVYVEYKCAAATTATAGLGGVYINCAV